MGTMHLRLRVVTTSLLAALPFLRVAACCSECIYDVSPRRVLDAAPVDYQLNDLFPLDQVHKARCSLDELMLECDGVRALTPAGRATMDYLSLKKTLADQLYFVARDENRRRVSMKIRRIISKNSELGDAARGSARAQEEGDARERRGQNEETRRLGEIVSKKLYALLACGWALKIGHRVNHLVKDGTDFIRVHYRPVEESRDIQALPKRRLPTKNY